MSVSWMSDGKLETLAQLNWIHFLRLKKQLLDADMLTEPFHWLQMSLPTHKLLFTFLISPIWN